MKTFAAVAFVIALPAFILLPLHFETAGSFLFAAGFAAIMVTDYTRAARPLRIPLATAVPTQGRKERFGLAA